MPGAVDGHRRNLELKATDADPERSRTVCLELGAESLSLLNQRDTYFNARRGRLKLREESDAPPHLIAYERPDLAGSRESRYRILAIEEPNELKAALADALGVRVVVAKERRLYSWQGVRIHLDRVDGLGDFIEFEAVAAVGSDLSEEKGRVSTLRQAFAIADADLLAESYGDLVLATHG